MNVSASHDAKGRICAIVNLRAGGWKRLQEEAARQDPVQTVKNWLAIEGEEPVVKVMQGAKDGTRLTLEALEEGCTTVVTVGGDGTVNDVVQGLCGEGTKARATLGLIPMGTANVLARIFNLPLRDPAYAARIIREGHTRTVDLGRSGTHWFAFAAGVGFDGAVTQAINRRFKRRFGEWAYVASAARQAVSYPCRRMVVRLDGGEPQTYDAYLVLAANGNRYAGRFQLGSQVRMDDGKLDVFICLWRRPLAAALVAHAVALGGNRVGATPGILHFQASRVEVESAVPLPVQLDGDAAGQTPVIIETVTDALTVLAPPERP